MNHQDTKTQRQKQSKVQSPGSKVPEIGIRTTLSLCLCVLVVLIPTACRRADRVVVGSKNFTEQIVLAEILAQQIERRTGLTVDRKLNLGGTLICHQALVAGQIDLYPEYTGTAFTAILKQAPLADARTSAGRWPEAGQRSSAGLAADVHRRVKEEYARRFGVEEGDSLGFENTFAILVRKADAERLGLKTISDAARYTPTWHAGFGYEFMERADGFPGLSRTYGLRFTAPPKVMDLTLSYRALAGRQVDLIAGNSTDGLIAALNLFMLQDDHHYFPPYEAVPLMRIKTLEQHPEIHAALQELSGRISTETMRRMNGAVDLEHRDPRQVAAEFLRGLKK